MDTFLRSSILPVAINIAFLVICCSLWVVGLFPGIAVVWIGLIQVFFLIVFAFLPSDRFALHNRKVEKLRQQKKLRRLERKSKGGAK